MDNICIITNYLLICLKQVYYFHNVPFMIVDTYVNTNVLWYSFTVVKFVMSLNFVDGYGKRKFF